MNPRFYDILNHSFYILFIVFCILFYKERLFNCDAGYYSWHVTNHADFFIKHDRWINYIMQYPAIVAINMELPLKVVLVIYSATFGVFYYFIFLLFRTFFISAKWALFPSLALLLALRYKHYAGHTEIVVAIFLAAIFLAFVLSKSFKQTIKWLRWVIIFILLFLMTITHPVIVLPIAIVFIFYFVYTENYKDLDRWIALGVTIFAFALRFYFSMGDSYESDKISTISNIFNVLIHPDQYDSMKIMVKYFLTDYLPVLFFGGYILYSLKSYSSKLFIPVFILANFGLFVLIGAIESYLRGDIYIMLDGYLGMFGLLWAFPIIKYLEVKDSKELRYALLALMIISASLIVSKSTFFLQRLDYYREIIKANPDRSKYYIPIQMFDWDEIWYPYEVPAEMLMLTALEGKQYCKTLYVNYDNLDLTEKVKKDDVFLFFTGSMKQNKLNPLYYQLPKEPYKKLDNVPWK